MHFAFNNLAVVTGGWLLAQSQEVWLYDFCHSIEEARLSSSRTERQALAELIGIDDATF